MAACILQNPEDELMEAQIEPGSNVEILLHCNDRKGGSYRWFFSCLEDDDQELHLKLEWEVESARDSKPRVVCERLRAKKEKGAFDVKAKGELRFILDNPNAIATTVSYGLVFHSAELLKTNALLESRSKREKAASAEKNSTSSGQLGGEKREFCKEEEAKII
mmetsp:Transcript_18071/g.25323  ORF Transcript_18071/g.25323 Transcript_18071/m.25323 type:complete len:163 (+) Transcript_18071:399-887(+)